MIPVFCLVQGTKRNRIDGVLDTVATVVVGPNLGPMCQSLSSII